MESELAALKLALTVAAAGELAAGGDRDGGIELLRQYQTDHPNHQAVTSAIVRLYFLHFEPPAVKAALAWEGPRLDEKEGEMYSSLLTLMQQGPPTQEALRFYHSTVDEDWFWHYPLGLNAWRTGEQERAWRHFEQYHDFSVRDVSRDSHPARWCAVFLTFMRRCQVCEQEPAALLYRTQGERILALCGSCKEVLDDEDLLFAVGEGRIPKTDPRIRRLSRVRQIFGRLGERQTPGSNLSRAGGPRMTFARLSTLEARLEERCRRVVLQAMELAKVGTLSDVDSVSLLSAVVDEMGTWGLDDDETAELLVRADKARQDPGIDQAGAMAQILNVAGWNSLVGFGPPRIGLDDLLVGLRFADKAASSAALSGFSGLTLAVDYSSPNQNREVLTRLRQRYPTQYLDILVRMDEGNFESYIWLVHNATELELTSPRALSSEESAAAILEWRDILSPSFPRAGIKSVLNLVGHRHGEAAAAVGSFSRKLFPTGFAYVPSDIFRRWSYVRKRAIARRILEDLDGAVRSSRSQAGRSNLLFLGLAVASSAELKEDQKRYASSMLEDVGEQSPPGHELYALETLFDVALAEGDSAEALRLLQKMRPSSEVAYLGTVQRALSLWRLGRRDEFFALLERLLALPDCPRAFLEETRAIYQRLGDYWTVEEVLANQPNLL